MKKHGTYSLKATPSTSSGQNYDGVQYLQTVADGSIEGWTYMNKMGTSLIPAFWIRTSTITTTNPSFNDGYFIRLYSSKAALYKVAGGVMTELSSSVNLGSITDRWWHLKISTYDNVIQAWYTQEESFTDQPQFSYIDLHHYLLEKQLFQQEQLCQELNMLLILIK